MISEKAGKHRKTFYYHFTNTDQLTIWIFRYDLAKCLQNSFPHDILIYEKGEEQEIFPEFPFYLRNRRKGSLIYNAPFFEALASTLEQRRFYYRKVFAETSRSVLQNYMYNLYCPILKDDILYLIDACLSHEKEIDVVKVKNHLNKKASVDFLAEYYTGAFIFRLTRRLNFAQNRRTLNDIVPFENVTHDSLCLLIREHSHMENFFE